VGGIKIFYSIVLEMKALQPGVYLEFPGKKIHGFLFNAIKEANEKLSQHVHDILNLKPFTVSPIFGTRYGGPTYIEEGKIYRIRATFLEDKLFEFFASKVMRDKILKNKLSIGAIEFLVNKVILDTSRSEWSSIFSPKYFFQENREFKTEITLSFITPTLFRTGDLHLSNPNAEIMFSGLFNKFNKYSDLKLDESIAEKLKAINISKEDIKVRKVYFDKFYLQGFTGDVTFVVDESFKEDKELLTAFNLLSEFSYYSGVGYKTTMGLGQVKVSKES